MFLLILGFVSWLSPVKSYVVALTVSFKTRLSNSLFLRALSLAVLSQLGVTKAAVVFVVPTFREPGAFQESRLGLGTAQLLWAWGLPSSGVPFAPGGGSGYT